MNTEQRKKWNSWINFFGLLLWAAVIPIAYFMGWIYSVAFISIASIYANLASHWAAWRADDDNIEEKLDKIIVMLTEISEKLDK